MNNSPIIISLPKDRNNMNIEKDHFLYLLTIESPINRVIASIIN